MSIDDKYGSFSVGPTSPIIGGFDVTPNDNSDLPTMTRAIMVAVDGDVAVVMANGGSLTLPGLVVGGIYPFRVGRILASGTTATGIVGLY